MRFRGVMSFLYIYFKLKIHNEGLINKIVLD